MVSNSRELIIPSNTFGQLYILKGMEIPQNHEYNGLVISIDFFSIFDPV